MMPASRLPDWTSRVKGSALAAPYSSGQDTMVEPAENAQLIVARIEASAHSSNSSLREQAIGHVFLGQLLTFMWRTGALHIGAPKTEDDCAGFSLFLESNPLHPTLHLKSPFR